MDKRQLLRADAPRPFKGKRPIVTHVDAEDYNAIYTVALHKGTSMSEALRELIRAAAAQLEKEQRS